MVLWSCFGTENPGKKGLSNKNKEIRTNNQTTTAQINSIKQRYK